MYRVTGLALVVMTCVLAQAFAADAVDASAGLIQNPLDGKGTVSVAPTQAEAEAAFQAARRGFSAMATGSMPQHQVGDINQTVDSEYDDVPAGGRPENVALEDIRLVLDVENVSLRDVMREIAQQAAIYTGPWTVKWRLKPENRDLLDETVNLTVEAPFGEFCSLLTERLKNMTGTQLYVTAFESSRILLVTDTYY